MSAAGPALVAVALSGGPDAAGAAAAALRLALEDLRARTKLEGLLPPAEAARVLGALPPTPPSFRYAAAVPPPPVL